MKSHPGFINEQHYLDYERRVLIARLKENPGFNDYKKAAHEMENMMLEAEALRKDRDEWKDRAERWQRLI